MSDHLPIVEVPESTWLRALAHALDPDAESSDESLVPEDEPVAAAADELDSDDGADDDDDASDDDASLTPGDSDPDVWDSGDSWSPSDDVDDAPAHLHHDDGVG
ncbi:hypothetical protein [Aeromicrobium sp. Sec7.5]|uniref:hypothetical protein n=1 Tax=Aeromicrobium sp. Sec7.5 TaxID=3121276 RepID=UPI002FE4C336